MPISSVTAIKFSNESVRPSADRLAKCYYKAIAVSTRWTALGSNQAALDLMQVDIKNASDLFISTYGFVYMVEKNWFLSSGPSTLFPNDTTQVWDNSDRTAQDNSRPKITGANVNNLINRCKEFQNWLLSAAGSFTDTTRAQVSFFNTVMQASNYGPSPVVLTDAGNFINRCNELKTNYETSSNLNLGTILAVAVNPN